MSKLIHNRRTYKLIIKTMAAYGHACTRIIASVCFSTLFSSFIVRYFVVLDIFFFDIHL